jgi:DNA-binding transcriptional LysR family regulator
MKSGSNSFTIDVRRLRVLRELHEQGTIAATAAALHLTPSAVSQQIASLSRETGVQLLARRGRGVRLTPQAHLLLDHAVAMDTQLERLRADLAAYDEGLVRRVVIGAFATAITAILAPAVARLGGERPRLQLSLREVEAPECFSRLDSGDLDLAVTVDYQGGLPHGDPRYVRHDLLADPFDLILPPHHGLATQEHVRLADLAMEQWIMGAQGGPCGQVILSACAAAGFSPDVRHHVNDWGPVFALVAAGCGVSLVPRLTLPTAPPPGVLIRAVNSPAPPTRNVYVAARSGSDRSPAIASVVAAMETEAQAASAKLAARAAQGRCDDICCA